MWQCRKCGRPVFFAERKQSLGFDWHPNCLRCEECGKRLNPGQHAEHKGVPYCHHPCYGALFGPQLFGHGTRNECHTSFGKVENRDGQVKRSHLEASLKVYNQYYEGKPGELKSREANGRMILEGVLKIYWGVRNVIHLKEEDDQRTIAVRRRSTASSSTAFYSDSDDEEQPLWREDDCLNGWRTPQSPSSPQIPKLSPMGRHTSGPSSDPATPAGENGTSGVSGRPSTSPHPATASAGEDGDLWGTRDQKTLKDLSAVAEGEGGSSLDLPTTPREDRPQCHRSLSVDSGTANSTRGRTSMLGGTQGSTQQIISTQSCDSSKDSDGATRESNGAGAGAGGEEQAGPEDANTPTRRAATKTGSTAIRRRPGRRMDKTKLKRRCSINGHFYLRETSTFTPPHGSPCSVWVTSLVTVEEVLNMLLEKYRVEMSTRNFALFVIKDNGERRRIREEEYPLITRVMLGPHEDVARVFIVDAQQTEEISPQVAQFLNLSLAECRAILGQYEQEEVRQIRAVRQKYEDLAFYIQRRMKELRGV